MIPELPLGTRTAVLGIGSGHGDDFAGPYIVQNITATERIIPFDCGTTPENFLGKVESANPDQILIIDAADFGGQPGEARIIDPSKIQLSVSTHNPTGMLITYLTTIAPVAVLGIQPASQTEFSMEVKSTANEIITLLSQPNPHSS